MLNIARKLPENQKEVYAPLDGVDPPHAGTKAIKCNKQRCSNWKQT
jgi:hypothetical protein